MNIYNMTLDDEIVISIKISDISTTTNNIDKRDIYKLRIAKTYTGWIYTILNQYNNSYIVNSVVGDSGAYVEDNVYGLNLHEIKILKDDLSVLRVNNGWLYISYNPTAYKIYSSIYVPQIIGGGSVGSGTTYTNSTPLPVAHGGALKDMTFAGLTMQEMFDLILYPYQAPSFTSFYLNGYSGSFEIGFGIAVNQVFNWDTNNDSNVKTNSIQISGNNLTTLVGLENDNTETITFNSIITRNSTDGPGTRGWTIQGVNTNKKIFSRNFSIRFDYKMYVGNSGSIILDETEIELLTDFNQVHNGHNGTFTTSAGGYKFIAFADVYGNVNAFKDPDTTWDIDMYDGYSNTELTWSYEIIPVTNILGQTTNYRLYRTTNILNDSQKITIS